MDDLRLVLFERLLCFCKPSHFGRDGVLTFGKVELDHAQSLLHSDQFVVALAQLVPGHEDLFNELFNGVAFEHPLEGRTLVVGRRTHATNSTGDELSTAIRQRIADLPHLNLPNPQRLESGFLRPLNDGRLS